MADRLVKGINESIKKYNLPFVCYNIGSICHLHTVATMHFKVDWKRPWTIPHVLKQTGLRQTEMQYMGAAYMAEGLVTLAGSRLILPRLIPKRILTNVSAVSTKFFQSAKKLITK